MTQDIGLFEQSPQIRQGIFHVPDNGSYELLRGWIFRAWQYQPDTPTPWWAWNLRFDADGTAMIGSGCRIWPGMWMLCRVGDTDIWSTVDSSSFDALWQDE